MPNGGSRDMKTCVVCAVFRPGIPALAPIVCAEFPKANWKRASWWNVFIVGVEDAQDKALKRHGHTQYGFGG